MPFNNYLFCSWANCDRNHLVLDSERYGVSDPVQAKHLNIKKRFAREVGVNMIVDSMEIGTFKKSGKHLYNTPLRDQWLL
jgi:hypothetical protein